MIRLSPRRLLLPVAASAALVLSVVAPASAATTVDLGTAGSFAVLAGSGITNTGATTIIGDIGTSPTPSETGVTPCPGAADCISHTGSNHQADAVALRAKQDLATAYDAAAGQPADAVLGADLAGLTVYAGVYRATSSLGLTGEVTLDGQGSPDAVFIFQVGTSLVTASGSRVTLVNGASACNVFFQVGSAATLGTGSTFRGTILAHDDISLGDSVTVEGRLLGGEQASGNGAVTLIHDTVSVPSCGSGSGSTTGGSTTGGTSSGGTTGGSDTGGTSSGGTSSGGTDTGGTSSGGTTGGSTGFTAGGSTASGPVQELPATGAGTGHIALLGGLLLLVGCLALLAGRPDRAAQP